ncbi:unnamed protein product, partial [Brassica rapa]
RHRRTSPRDAFGEEDGFFLLPTLRRSSRLRISSQPPSTKRIIYSEVLVFTTQHSPSTNSSFTRYSQEKVRSGGVAEINTEVVVSQ